MDSSNKVGDVPHPIAVQTDVGEWEEQIKSEQLFNAFCRKSAKGGNGSFMTEQGFEATKDFFNQSSTMRGTVVQNDYDFTQSQGLMSHTAQVKKQRTSKMAKTKSCFGNSNHRGAKQQSQSRHMKEEINNLRLQLLACKEQLEEATKKGEQLKKLVKIDPAETKLLDKSVQTSSLDFIPFTSVEAEKLQQSKGTQQQASELQSNLETDVSLRSQSNMSLREEKDCGSRLQQRTYEEEKQEEISEELKQEKGNDVNTIL